MKFLIVTLFLLSSCSGSDETSQLVATQKSKSDAEINQTVETADTNETPDPAETLYTISIDYDDFDPVFIKLSAQGKSLDLSFDPEYSYDAYCVALSQSELVTFTLTTYETPSSISEDCSCNNSDPQNPCITEFNHYVYKTRNCSFEVLDEDEEPLFTPSTCKRLQ